MHLLVTVSPAHLEPGDIVLGSDNGVGVSTYVVHHADDTEVTFLHGVKANLPRDMELLVSRDFTAEEHLVEVEDPRPRPDLKEAEEGRARVARGEPYFGALPVDPAVDELAAAKRQVEELQQKLAELQEQDD